MILYYTGLKGFTGSKKLDFNNKGYKILKIKSVKLANYQKEFLKKCGWIPL